MNAPARLAESPEVVLLCVDDFQLLRDSGAFRDYVKVELLQGALEGVPRAAKGKPQSDASFPIKLRVEDYELLAGAGSFGDEFKTELVDGLVYRMSPQFKGHGFVKDELAYRLRRRLEEMGSPLHVATEQSVTLSRHSQPQPDVILTSEPKGEGAIPGTTVALLVEVAQSTGKFDLGEKKRVYAEAGVPEYWVVDLTKGLIFRMASPGSGEYGDESEVKLGERIEAATIAGLGVETGGI